MLKLIVYFTLVHLYAAVSKTQLRPSVNICWLNIVTKSLWQSARQIKSQPPFHKHYGSHNALLNLFLDHKLYASKHSHLPTSSHIFPECN